MHGALIAGEKLSSPPDKPEDSRPPRLVPPNGGYGQARALPTPRTGYWVVDTDARLVERWRPVDDRPELLRETAEWHPLGAPLPFVLDSRHYFDSVRHHA